MAKRVLGNDPFVRGAAAREPDVPGTAAATPAGRAVAGEATELAVTPEASVTPPAVGAPTTEVPPPEGPAAPVEPRPSRRTEPPLPRPKRLPREKPPAPRGKGQGRAARPAPEKASTAGPAPAKASAAGSAPAKASTARPEADSAKPKAGRAKPKTSPPAGPAPKPVVRVPGKKTLPRSPFDLPPPSGDPASRFVIEVKAEVAAVAVEIDAVRSPVRDSFDAGDLAADGGLLPADLAAAVPAPRVVAMPPLPEKAPAPANFVAIARSTSPTGADAARGMVALLQRLGRVDAALPSLEVDEFGRDPAFEAKVRPLLGWMYRHYFRVEEHGLDKLPRGGPLILVANRAGAIPWDAAMVNVAAARHGREVRPLLEDAVFHFPFLGVLVNRLGAVRACPENAERILSAGGAVTVFPEGAGGFAKPFRDRYRLQRFGRGGFVRLALRTGATIVPVAVIGSEEIYPLIGRVPAKPLGIPFFPITPTWPWLGAAGLWPLPSKWSIELGDPVDLSGLGPDAASDSKVMRIADSVRTTIQAMLDARLAGRTTVFAG